MAAPPAPAEADAPVFTCAACQAHLPLARLAPLECACMLCAACAAAGVARQLEAVAPHQREPAGAGPPPADCDLGVGAEVLYVGGGGVLRRATIVQVDRAVQPPQYGLTFGGGGSGGGDGGGGGDELL